MIKSQEAKLTELLRKASIDKLIPNKTIDSVNELVLNISKLIFKHSVFIEFDSDYDDGVINKDEFEQIINKYII